MTTIFGRFDPEPHLVVSAHEDWASLPVGRDEWNRLMERGSTRTVFQTHEWNDAWLAAFAGQWRPLTLLVHYNKQLVAIAPFVVERTGIGRPRVALQGHGNADYQDVIGLAKRPIVYAVLRELAQRVPDAIVDLAHVPASSPSVSAIPHAARAAGLWPLRRGESVCPTLLLRGHEEHARRLVNRYSVRRPLNYFSRFGPVVARRITAQEEVLARLPDFFDQHVRRWRETSTPSLFRRPEPRRFFEEMVRRLSAPGWLDFSVIELAGRPLAYHFGFRYGNLLTWYKPSFEVEVARHSPGILMIRHLIERSLDEGLDEVDFTIGTEQFKSRYTNRSRVNFSWRLFSSRYAFQVGRLIRAARHVGGLAHRGRPL